MQTRALTFADRFSRIKLRVLIVFWLVFVLAVLKMTMPTLTSYYSIYKAQESFYSITVKDDLAQYTRVTTMPEHWVPLDKISKRIQGAIISSEDGKFYMHPGYDLEQMQGAIDETFVKKKKKMRGASTITQQLVKNLFLTRSRTFGRKGQELIMALMIEKHADKKKILESYLNVIEYGKGLYGIEAASKYYFNKKPAQITAREAAFLAMLLPSPTKYSKSFKTKTLTTFANRMIASILLKMRQGGYIGEEEYIEQLNSHFSWEKPAVNTNTNDAKDNEEFGDDGAAVEGNDI
jgi:monofunctional biosynthetic peptidoglycan transglycosylase